MATDYNMPIGSSENAVVMESGETVTLEDIMAEQTGQTIDPNIPGAPEQSAANGVINAGADVAQKAVETGEKAAETASKHPIAFVLIVAAIALVGVHLLRKKRRKK